MPTNKLNDMSISLNDSSFVNIESPVKEKMQSSLTEDGFVKLKTNEEIKKLEEMKAALRAAIDDGILTAKPKSINEDYVVINVDSLDITNNADSNSSLKEFLKQDNSNNEITIDGITFDNLPGWTDAEKAITSENNITMLESKSSIGVKSNTNGDLGSNKSC